METVLSLFGKDLLGACPKEFEEQFEDERQRLIDQMPLEDEELDAFFEESEEIRGEPELGGLGPGLTGEYTLYNLVIVRNDKRWKMKKRFSQFYTFDRQLLQAIKQAGGDESKLPEFPSKQLFGKMSPSLVKTRQSQLQDYFKILVKDTDLTKEPLVRVFLKLPMNAEEVEKLASGVEGDGLLGGCGTFKSLYQRTREEKAKGIHHTQKREMFAGPPTLRGASEVGAAFAGSSIHDGKDEKKWVFRIPILADLGGQTVKDVFGNEVRGLHSTYNNQIKEQVERSSKDTGAKKKSKAPSGDGSSPAKPKAKA